MGLAPAALLLLPAAAGAATVRGAGSALQAAAQAQWAAAYKAVRPTVDVSFASQDGEQAVGLLRSGRVDFAVTDRALPEADYASFQMLPLALAPIAVLFNIPGLTDLTLDRSTLHQIFTGAVTRWDEAVVAGSNPGVPLPSEQIRIVVRGDDSDETRIFTAALVSFSGTGTPSSRWSEYSTRAGVIQNNSADALAQQIADTPYSIGYGSFATRLATTFATLRNRQPVATRPDSTLDAHAAAAGQFELPRLTANLIDGPGYPILGVTYAVIPHFARQCESAAAAISYLLWSTMDFRARSAAVEQGLIPIPDELLRSVLGAMAKPRCLATNETLCTSCVALPLPPASLHTWGYVDTAAWGDLPGSSCAFSFQSPIDISSAPAPPRWAFGKLWQGRVQSEAVANRVTRSAQGVSLRVAEPSASFVTLLPRAAQAQWVIREAFFRFPSEHTLGGVRYPAEIQIRFVRADLDDLLFVTDKGTQSGYGELAMAVLLRAGEAPESAATLLLQGLLDAGVALIPEGSYITAPVSIPAALFGEHEWFSYSGSSSTPPCREGVEWLVSAEPALAHAALIRSMQTVVAESALSGSPGDPASDPPVERGNARPLRELHGRVVERVRFFQYA